MFGAAFWLPSRAICPCCRDQNVRPNRVRTGGLGEGEGQGELGAAVVVGGVVGGGGAAVFVGDGGDDGEAEAGADAGTGAVGLPEAVEDVGEGVGVEAGAVVADGDVGVAVDEVGADLDGRSVGRVRE